jgi:hypothetical protein
VVKPLGEYLGVFLWSFELFLSFKSCKNNIWWFKVVWFTNAAKVLIHSPMQLKMVPAAVHLQAQVN